MITPKMSAPTPKSMPWPTPQRPAQAAPVRRESVAVPAGGVPGSGGGNGGWGGITPGTYKAFQGESSPFAGLDDV